MLTFVTTIRHPANAVSYQRIGRLLDGTLRSVCQQTDPDFRVIVVHNERPAVSFEHPSVSYVQVHFPPPATGRGRFLDFGALCRDKGTKTVIGVAAARDAGANHVMFVDSDDFMHRDLAGHANARLQHPGWFSPKGYIYTLGSRRISKVSDGFHHKNGSTSILRTDLVFVPPSVAVTSDQAQIYGVMDLDYVSSVLGQHGNFGPGLAERGYAMEPLPFPAAVWNIGTGENHSGNLVSARESQALAPELANEFGMIRPSVVESTLRSGAVWARRITRKARRSRK